MEEKVFHWTDFWNFRKKVSPVEDFECQSRGRVCPVERYLLVTLFKKCYQF